MSLPLKQPLQTDVPSPDMIQMLLANILSKFRVKNPGLFILIQFGLGVLIYGIANCQELGICVNKLFGSVLMAANYLMVILLSSKTASVVMSYNQGTYGSMGATKKPDLLQTIIAGLLDKFKVKSPKLFLLIQFGLGVIAFALTNCAELGICLQPIFAKILGVVDFALMCLISPRTSFILDSVALVPKEAAVSANIEIIE
jgi:hypothetical protein